MRPFFVMKLSTKQLNIIESYEFESVNDLLGLYPYRYETYQSKPIKDWVLGETIIINGFLASPFKMSRFGKNKTLVRFQVIYDNTIVNVNVFNQPYIMNLKTDNGLTILGVYDKNGSVNAKRVTNTPIHDLEGIQPVYPLKKGIKQHEVKKLIDKILNSTSIPSIIPKRFELLYKLLPKEVAIRKIHQPKHINDVQVAARTLKYEEFLRYHLSVAINQNMDKVGIAKKFDISNYEPDSHTSILSNLPFSLTNDQLSTLNEILNDLKSTKRMNRLLQGDVGSGKTIVAFLSALAAVEAGYQVAIMAPTEILVHQHFQSFIKIFKNSQVGILSAASADKDATLESLKRGEIKIVIGTHTLFSDSTQFKSLGLVVIDEQHRFGVSQRRKLLEKGEKVDCLMMSATPIPRTLANSLYFDLDVSTIQNQPAHRKTTITQLIDKNSIQPILEDLHSAIKNGEQIYIVCPAIVEGEREGIKNVVEIYGHLKNVFGHEKVGMLHGAMTQHEKDSVMSKFNNNSITVLVSTTVIEVGVDVHNATRIVIYNAEQFGLATLHQLRGRVGRGGLQGVCYLLSSTEDSIGKSRLKSLESIYDGFELSMIDLRMRGSGDALGTRQSGLPNFILGDLEKDIKILTQAKIDAKMIIEDKDNQDYKKIINSVLLQDYFKLV